MEQAIKKAMEGGWIKSPYPFHFKEIIGDDGRGHTAVIRFTMPTKSGSMPSDSFYHVEWIFQQPSFWQALGKAMGWDKKVGEGCCESCGEPMPEGEAMFRYHGYSINCSKPPIVSKEWKKEWHRFIDHLIAGKDPDSFFIDLLK